MPGCSYLGFARDPGDYPRGTGIQSLSSNSTTRSTSAPSLVRQRTSVTGSSSHDTCLRRDISKQVCQRLALSYSR